VRELREEVGIDVPVDALAQVNEWTFESDLLTDHVHVFELRLDDEPAIALDHREVVWAAFETVEAARRRPLLPVVARYLGERDAASGG
jgi:8-oxo-dGTP pyrophosphatase MutT (NUDIX family)